MLVKIAHRSMLLALGLAATLHCAAQEETPVQLDMFFSPGCEECERVKTIVLPEVEELFAGQYDRRRHDITQAENIPLLTVYKERCGNRENGKVSIVVDHHIFFSGYSAISTGLVACIDGALVQRQLPGWTLPPAPDLENGEAEKVVRECADGMTFSVVALGGLIDGINPCAISTLIFFISILVVAKVEKKIRLLVGLSFILASFVVYMSMGLGFIFALRQAPNFLTVRRVVEFIIGVGMIPLAYLSFRDAFRFYRTERPEHVTLQIPKGIKRRINSYMNSRMGVGGPIIGGLVTGAGVTILESVCTGQSYIPVLMYMLKRDLTDLCSWVLLTLYNLLFVLPLVIVFVCFHYGMEVTSLISWSKRNLVIAKILLGIFFTAMALLLLL